MTEKKKIYLLSGIIVFICILFLSLNFILNRIDASNKNSISDGNADSEKDTIEKIADDKNSELDHDPFSNMLEISDIPSGSVTLVKKVVAESESNSQKSINSDEVKIESKHESLLSEESVKLPKSPFKIPEAKNDATLYFVFDDAGQNSEFLARYVKLPFPFAVSVLPSVTRSAECAEIVRAGKKELMLHQPMQAENLELPPGPAAVSAIMNTKEIAELVISNIESLGGGVKGVSNHEGSLVTSNIVKIGAVLEVCKAKKIYFLDSRTTAQSKAVQAGIELDAKVLVRSAPFLDNEVNREKILQRIYESLDYANTHGKAIMIGHIDKSVNILPDLLTEMYPYLVRAGYKFSVPSEIK